MLLVYLDLTMQRKHFGKYWLTVIIVVLVVSLIVSFVPIEEYQKCKIGGYDLYCGACFESHHSAVLYVSWTVFALPVLLGVITTGLLVKVVCSINSKKQLNRIQRNALNVVFIPSIAFLYILINSILTVISANNDAF